MCSREELQWVGARNVPILCGRMTTLVSQQGGHMIAVVNWFSAKKVDYGVNETSDWRVFSTGPHTQRSYGRE
jgi:hypothetical protein